jgi:hypothetical protein
MLAPGAATGSIFPYRLASHPGRGSANPSRHLQQRAMLEQFPLRESVEGQARCRHVANELAGLEAVTSRANDMALRPRLALDRSYLVLLCR